MALRENTQRPVTISVGANVLAEHRQEDIVKCARDMKKKHNRWKNPFGDGRTGERIIEVTINFLDH